MDLFPEAIQIVFVSCFLESTIFIFCYANLFFDVLHCMFSIFIINCKQIQSNLCQIFWQIFFIQTLPCLMNISAW